METANKPDSVSIGLAALTRVIISLGDVLPHRSSDLPEDLGRAGLVAREALSSPYLILLRATLAVPEVLPPSAVGSYPTVSPLPELA